MNPARLTARALRSLWGRIRFRAWALRLRLAIRRNGGRLLLVAPHGAKLETSPRIRALLRGEGDGVFELVVGRGVCIGADLVLEVWARGSNRLVLSDRVDIYDHVKLELHSGSIELGRGTTVRDLSLLKSTKELRVGSDVIVSRGVFIQCAERIEIGDRSALGEWVSLIDSDHAHDGSDTYFLEQPTRYDPITVGSNTLVARGAVVLRGARVGRNSLVAANSVVMGGEYPASRLLAGSPATERSLGAKRGT